MIMVRIYKKAIYQGPMVEKMTKAKFNMNYLHDIPTLICSYTGRIVKPSLR